MRPRARANPIRKKNIGGRSKPSAATSPYQKRQLALLRKRWREIHNTSISSHDGTTKESDNVQATHELIGPTAETFEEWSEAQASQNPPPPPSPSRGEEGERFNADPRDSRVRCAQTFTGPNEDIVTSLQSYSSDYHPESTDTDGCGLIPTLQNYDQPTSVVTRTRQPPVIANIPESEPAHVHAPDKVGHSLERAHERWRNRPEKE